MGLILDSSQIERRYRGQNMKSIIDESPGDLELLTEEGKRFIVSADIMIYAGYSVNPKVLDDAKLTSKIFCNTIMNLDKVVKLQIDNKRRFFTSSENLISIQDMPCGQRGYDGV